jgi:uncharacterized coiled-coil protein SlyX
MKNLVRSETPRTFVATTLAAAVVWFLPLAQAVVPAPDGGYPNLTTAEGQNALSHLTTGVANSAVGWYSLWSNTDGSYNTAVGAGTLVFNVGNQSTLEGSYNTATGVAALLSNTTGHSNTANGVLALFTNTEGSDNIAVGTEALFSNTTGVVNVAVGDSALYHNSTGLENTAIGDSALTSNTSGAANTAVGDAALFSNDGSQCSTAIGAGALLNSVNDNNTAVGCSALNNNTTGSNNTALGTSAGANLTTGDNNIDIGYNVVGVNGESNTIRIGNTDITDTYIRGISGATASGGAGVFVNSNGKLGTLTSSARFKDEIKPMDKASETILGLKPVSFRYKKEIDPQRIPQFGLVAEEVQRVNPDLVVRDAKGRPETVRYEQINAMLLNEFLKEHRKMEVQGRKIQEQEATIAQLKSDAAKQADAIDELKNGMNAVIARIKNDDLKIQQVSDRIETNNVDVRIATNDLEEVGWNQNLR